MRTWEDYKDHVKSISEEERRNMEEIEEVSSIVSSIIRRRQELGISCQGRVQFDPFGRLKVTQ